MIKRYSIYLPADEGKFEYEMAQCLEQMAADISSGLRPLKMNIFITLAEDPEFTVLRNYILKSVIKEFGDKTPAVSVTVHPPQRPWKIAVETLFLVSGYGEAETKYYGSMPYVVITKEWGKEIWGAGLGSGFISGNIRDASQNAFNNTVELLALEDMSLNNIVRQWNYIGNILTLRNGFQHYQVFNEVRSEYYARHRSVTGYPAATGIGMKSESVIIDFCALIPDHSVKIIGMSNPDQVNAYEYGQKVLKGVRDAGKTKKQPPQFERALIMAHGNSAVLYISGTASIKGQETIGKNDVGRQTEVTLENIRKLTDRERICSVLPQGSAPSVNYSLLRIYIRHQEDFETVAAVCREQFSGVPMIFIQADVCRNDLLTEIEAEVQIQF